MIIIISFVCIMYTIFMVEDTAKRKEKELFGKYFREQLRNKKILTVGGFTNRLTMHRRMWRVISFICLCLLFLLFIDPTALCKLIGCTESVFLFLRRAVLTAAVLSVFMTAHCCSLDLKIMVQQLAVDSDKLYGVFLQSLGESGQYIDIDLSDITELLIEQHYRVGLFRMPKMTLYTRDGIYEFLGIENITDMKSFIRKTKTTI